jgi:Fic family protein
MDWQTLTLKKQQLDCYKPLPLALITNLEEWYRVELTYTSNALEGNTLTRQETALVVEKNIAIGGKSLREHFEAINHAEAVDFIQTLINKKSVEITADTILDIHRIILKNIDNTNAGIYRSVHVRLSGSQTVLPNPVKVPKLMEDFFQWIAHAAASEHPAKLAADAHFKLVTIHPFADGNGRTARLLMNLILMQNYYPPAIIPVEKRLAYINALEKAQTTDDKEDYE